MLSCTLRGSGTRGDDSASWGRGQLGEDHGRLVAAWSGWDWPGCEASWGVVRVHMGMDMDRRVGVPGWARGRGSCVLRSRVWPCYVRCSWCGGEGNLGLRTSASRQRKRVLHVVGRAGTHPSTGAGGLYWQRLADSALTFLFALAWDVYWCQTSVPLAVPCEHRRARMGCGNRCPRVKALTLGRASIAFRACRSTVLPRRQPVM